MSEFMRTAMELSRLPSKIPPEVEKALKVAAERVVAAALPGVAKGGTKGADYYGLRYRGPYQASGERWSVQFRPTFVARYKEGGAKAHVIDPSAAGSRKNLKFQRRKFKSAFRAQDKVASAKTAKSRATWEAKGAAALEDASAAQRGEVALGVLAIGRGKGKNRVDVSPGAKPNSNFARRVNHPGIQASKPIAHAINRIKPVIAEDLRRHIDTAWATVHRR